jgi:hypothetical protein
VQLAGVFYNLTFTYRNGWFMDIADVNKVPLISGIAMVTGADLLAQYAYIGIGGMLVLSGDNAPGFADLGANSQLYFIA